MKANRKHLIESNYIADTYALTVPTGHELLVTVPKGTHVEFAPVALARPDELPHLALAA
jgi:hypothetical protein